MLQQKATEKISRAISNVENTSVTVQLYVHTIRSHFLSFSPFAQRIRDLTMAEEKSELWNKFYEEEKARLERELLQTVFGTSATSTGSSTGQPRPQSGPVTVKPFVNSIPSSSATATTNPQPSSKRSQPLVEAHLMFGSPAGEPAPIKAAVAPIPVQQSPTSQLTTRNLASQFTDAGQNDATLSPVDLNSEKLRNISNELVSKWANEYVASSQTVQRVVPAQKQHLLEALMKMRGAGKN